MLVELDGRRLEQELRGRQVKLLLAYLVLHRARPASRDELTDALWPYALPDDPAASLSTVLSRLRRALGPGRLAGRAELRLELPADFWVDVEAAVQANERAHAALTQEDWVGALKAAREALPIVEGDLLPGHDAPWLDERRSKLKEVRAAALECVAQAGLTCGGAELPAAERAARELIEHAPFRETGYQRLMEAHAARGNAAEALQVYDLLRVFLRDELGAAPSAPVLALHRRLLEGETGTAPPREKAPAPGPSSPPKDTSIVVPPPLRTCEREVFVGRGEELDRLHAALGQTTADARAELVTPAGEAGIAKTRLAPTISVMSAVGEVQLLERERELAVVDRLVDALSEGGRLLALEAPAGMGKTRLITEARARAQASGMRVLSARGSELERGFSYGVVRQLFEPLLVSAPAAERAELLEGAARAAEPLFEHGDVSETSADASFATLHGLFWLIANLAARGPLALAIDDLHWCDPPSLRWLAHLLPRIEGIPLLVVVGLRPEEPGADLALLGRLTGDPRATVLRPAPISEAAATELLRARLSPEPDAAFVRACHVETRGNPLLLSELASAIVGEGLSPTAEEAPRVRELGAQAVARAVSLRLSSLPDEVTRLARAVAVLGDGAELRHAAALAELDDAAASEAAVALRRTDVLGATEPLEFAHPVVRSAVYAGLGPLERARAHARAARLLADSSAEPERAAAHLLLVRASRDREALRVLRAAARQALGRGAPDSAVAYLRRALDEEPPERERNELLLELGSAEGLVSGPDSVEHLNAALELIDDPLRRARTAVVLGRQLLFVFRPREAVDVFTRALEELGGEDPELGRLLEAGLINTAMFEPPLYEVAAERLARVRREPAGATAGEKRLLALLAYHDARANTPAAEVVPLARRALAEGTLLEEENGGGPFVLASMVLAMADLEEAVDVYDASLTEAHRRGSVFALAAARIFRAQAFVFRGDLAEAEAEGREAMDASEAWRIEIAPGYSTAFVADALMEQGKLEEAATVLKRAGFEPEQAPDSAHGHWFLDSWARLRIQTGDVRRGLADTLEAGRRFEAVAGRNPAFMAWRSTAALALLELGEGEVARRLAAEELELARRWSAPRALGRALRVTGLAEGGATGIDLLYEAAEVLERSAARLEYAKGLTDLGAALRRANRRFEARKVLRRGLELATLCRATPVAEHAEREILATGARSRKIYLSGVESLTPSERRVAEMAAQGRKNREIAQALFVTVKTVELHLSEAYRKLGVAARTELPALLKQSSARS